MLSRGIMLEGISCAGKTSTMYAIKRLFASDMNLERNVIMLGEHYTQVLNSINGELKTHGIAEHTEMLFNRVSMIEKLNEWACDLGEYNTRSRGLYTIFERGLINHIAFFEDYDDSKISNLAERFSDLGIEAILLVISDDQLLRRIMLRDEQLKNKHPRHYYSDKVEQEKIQQEKMVSAVNKVKIPSRIICTDSMNWDEYAKTIINL